MNLYCLIQRTMVIVFLWGMLLALLSSCQEEVRSSLPIPVNKDTGAHPIASIGIDCTHVLPDYHCKACLALQEVFESHLDSIIQYPKDYLGDNNFDSCVLGIINSLQQKFSQTKDIRYMDALSALCKVSDGYVAETIGEVLYELFKTDTYRTASYLYQHRRNNKEMIFLWSAEIVLSQSEKEARNIITHAPVRPIVKDFLLRVMNGAKHHNAKQDDE